MLKFFRDQKDSWLVKGILILTALSFMSLFGIQGMSEMRQRNKAVIKVGGKSITTQEFLNAFNQKLETLNRMTDNRYTINDAIDGGMLMMTLNELSSRKIMETAAERLHLTISDDAVRSVIRQMPAFMGFDGNFSREAYNEYLRNMAKTENQFVSEMFLDLKTAQLAGAARAATVVPKDIAETAYRLRNEKRNAEVFTVSTKDISVTAKPTQEELQKLYEEMSEDLIAPEYRSISVMYLTLDDVASKIQISDEELRELYNENKDDYTIEEIRDVDQMLFMSEEEADKAFKALQKGQDFMKVAEKFANQTTDQTRLGDITPSTATGDWADVVFTAKRGEVVGPVETAFGWQILRVNKIIPKVERKFAEVKKELAEKIKAASAFDQLMEMSVELDDRLGAGESLESVSKSAGLTLKKYNMVDSMGTDENGKEVDIAKSILSVAFISEPSRESPMIEEGNSFFVLRVDDIRDPTLKSLNKAMPQIKTAWKEQKQKEAAREIVKKVEERLKKGDKTSQIAQMKAVSYKAEKDLQRDNTVLPSAATYSLFAADKGKVISTPALGGYVVARVTKITPADPKKDIIGVHELRLQMADEIAREKADSLLTDFGAEYELSIDENAVAQAFSYISRPVEEGED